MLTYLSIKNFTIIDSLELELPAGMIVLTGETGAGKSIVIDALDLVLGGRADSQTIRHGAERCEIHASFSVREIPAAHVWLTTHDLASEDDCLLRRSLSRDGKSRAFINGHPVTLQQLRELAAYLINIHGQHEHQTLLQRDAQRDLLDAYGKHTKLCEQVAAFYRQWRAQQKTLQEQQQRLADREARLAFLSYQVQELDQLNLTVNELTALEEEHKTLANADQHIQTCQQLLMLFNDADNHSVLNQLHHSAHLLAHLNKSGLNELLESATIQLQELVNELQRLVNHLEPDPARLQEIEQRLQQIHDLARKHRVKPEELPALQQKLHEELTALQRVEMELQDLQQTLAKTAQQYQTAAEQLSQKRQQAAKTLAKQIEKHMQTLGMPGGRFAITLEPVEEKILTSYGLEKIEFLVSSNPGQPLQPLAKVASGGELSRISLAIQVIAAQNQRLPTLIFDEVDVGVGGGTAAIVGQLLKQLSNTAQVLCITHLPQVAAQGQTHLQVQKTVQQKQTSTQIKFLSAEERIKEIARMLGGLTITEQTLAHARELVSQ